MAQSKPTRRSVVATGLGAIGAALVGCTRSSGSVQEASDEAAVQPLSEVTGGVSIDGGAGTSSEQASHTVDASEEASPEPTVSEGPARPLLQRYPQLGAALPWIDLGGLPAPVASAEALGRRLGLEGIRIKCDDRAGTDYGGSKARKLEHALGQALQERARRVITFGGMGSNHALATAVHARRLGLECRLMLLPEPPSEHARIHLFAEHRLGCELVAATAADVRDPEGVLARANDEMPSYLIPMGGTSPLGNTGYVNAAFELAAQCGRDDVPVPDVIYVALGTAGTAAGLYVGLRAMGLPTRLVAVRASNPGTGSLRNLRREIESTSRFLHELDPSFPEVEATDELLHLEHGFAGRGYAIPTEEGARAAALVQEVEGIHLDSTYTAKAFAALVHDAPRLAGQSVLFWNTYDPREVSTDGVSPEDLPRAFRRYVGRGR